MATRVADSSGHLPGPLPSDRRLARLVVVTIHDDEVETSDARSLAVI